MKKSITKLVLVATVASMAIAMSMTVSEAAKKKSMSCTSPSWCAKDCTGALCAWYVCTDGKWRKTAIGVCAEPFCSPKC